MWCPTPDCSHFFKKSLFYNDPEIKDKNKGKIFEKNMKKFYI